MAERAGWQGNWTFQRMILALSLLPFMLRALDYARLGSFVPLAVWLLFAGLIVWGVTTSSLKIRGWIIRLWAASLILWSLARLALLVLHVTPGLPEAHLSDQMNVVYTLVSVSHLLLGGYLFNISRTPRQ